MAPALAPKALPSCRPRLSAAELGESGRGAGRATAQHHRGGSDLGWGDETGPVRHPARPTRCPSASLGAGRIRRPSGCYSRGGSRALRKVAVARKAKNNPQAGSRAPNPHSGREACARRSLLEGCVHAQGRVSLTPRYACPQGLPGRSPRRHGGVCREGPREEPARNGLVLIPVTFGQYLAPRPLLGFWASVSAKKKKKLLK